jgi:uncharacterized protein (DUF849 family)
MVERLALTMKDRGIKLEVFDAGMVSLRQGLPADRAPGGAQVLQPPRRQPQRRPATLASLAHSVQSLPPDSTWAATRLGQFQLPINAAAIVAGGHVRVGIEDPLFFHYDKTIPATNENLVWTIVRIATEPQRPLTTATEARALVALDAPSG